MKTENIILIIIMLIMCVICVGSVVAHDMSFTKTDNMSYKSIAHNEILSEIDNTSDISLNGFNYLLNCLHSFDCNTYGTSLINPNGELTEGKSIGNIQLTGENNTSNNTTDVNSTNSTVSIADILDAAIRTKTFIEQNQQLPDYITIGGKQYSCAEALYLFDKAIVNIENGDFSDIEPVSADEPDSPSGTVYNSKVYESEYVDVSNRVANYIVNNGFAPNYASSSVGLISYPELIDMSSRILAYYKNNDNTMPLYVTVYNKIGPTGGTVQEVANKVCEGLTTEQQKANALFNYVHNNIGYEFYYNTRYGAQGTLDHGAGNCCDQARLYVAMCQAVGLTTKYMHGECFFIHDQCWYGHVWSKVSVNGQFVTSDTTGHDNTLGHITNWKTDSVRIIKEYEPGEDLGF